MRTPKHLLMDAGDYSLDLEAIGGIGLRLVELADVLSQDFDVCIFSPTTRKPPTGNFAVHVHPEQWSSVLAQAFAVMTFDMPDRRRLEDIAHSGVFHIAENAPPLEQLQYPSLSSTGDQTYLDMVDSFTFQARNADFFMVRSAVEMATMAASLCCLGRITPSTVGEDATFGTLMSLVPIGYSASSLHRAQTASPLQAPDFLWTGGLWSYFDPGTVIDAIAYCHQRGVPATLGFLHCQETADTRDTIASLKEQVRNLNLGPYVSFFEDTPSEETRNGLIKSSKGLICIARPGIENRTCVRLRVRDSRLHGIPTLVDAHGPTFDELSRDGLATPIAQGGPVALAKAMMRLHRGISQDRPRFTPSTYVYETTMSSVKRVLQRELRRTKSE